jgi:1-phosphofructokinase family hexose kinase
VSAGTLRVATLTLNPAIDQMIDVPGFRAGQVNRVRSVRTRAGGKGINVATVLATLGMETAATGFLGTDNAALFERHLAAHGIRDGFVRVPGSTRTGLKILADGQTTDLNFPGLEPAAEHLEALHESVAALAGQSGWFVLSGSVPPGVPAEVYRTLVGLVRAKGCAAALDTSGEALRLALDAVPELVKPNVHELAELLGRPLEGVPEVAEAARELVRRGIRLAVVSMGEAGAVYADAGRTLLARPLRVAVRSTVGAGDAMVAGTVAGLARGLTPDGCARLATALAAGAVQRLETGAPPLDELESMQGQVVVEEIG